MTTLNRKYFSDANPPPTLFAARECLKELIEEVGFIEEDLEDNSELDDKGTRGWRKRAHGAKNSMLYEMRFLERWIKEFDTDLLEKAAKRRQQHVEVKREAEAEKLERQQLHSEQAKSRNEVKENKKRAGRGRIQWPKNAADRKEAIAEARRKCDDFLVKGKLDPSDPVDLLKRAHLIMRRLRKESFFTQEEYDIHSMIAAFLLEHAAAL